MNLAVGTKLAEFTTFQLGGPCRGLITVQTPAQLTDVVKDFIQQRVEYILIGGGSNLLVSDQGLNCHVIRYLSRTPLIQQDGEDLIVTGSTLLDALAEFAANNALEGLNCTTGIPGTVGGAIVGNAGAFGQQIGDCLKSVTLLTHEGIKREVGPDSLGFRYRYSVLKKTNDIVVAARLGLKKGDKKTLLDEREEILRIRREKHPDLTIEPCAGSFFRNIEPTSKAGKRQAAGWFLDQAGAKSLRVGGAAIFKKHANIIIKKEGCTAQNVYDLSKLMAKAVKEKFNLDLVREVRLIGKFDESSKNTKNI